MKTMTRPVTRPLPVDQHDAACCTPLVVPTRSDEAAGTAVRRFKALADPTRLAILGTLAATPEPVCACDLGEGVDLEQPTISHHLKVLREAGLVISERRGTWGFYRLHPDAAAWVRATLAAMPR
jgi:ArsR family transcriptional regulator, arsenate/arsenite/antimonite-responsive transcriptional repressor